MRSSDDVSASMPVRYDGSTVTVYEITSRSGSDRLPPDHVHDSNHDDGPDQGDDERHDEARRSGSKDQREDKPAYERSNDPEDDIPDDPVAVSTHDLAR